MGGGLGAMPLYIIKRMKQISVLILVILFVSCVSTKNDNSSEQVGGIGNKLTHETIFTSCLIFNEYKFYSEIISYSFNKSKDSLSFQGKVYESISNEPLVGAKIELLPCSTKTSSDLDGLFKFKYEINKCDSIQISYIGYSTTKYALKEFIKFQ